MKTWLGAMGVALVAATASVAGPRMVISDGGVYGVSASTPFRVSAIQALMPTMRITAGKTGTEGEPVAMIVARDRGGVVRYKFFADDAGHYVESVYSTDPALTGVQSSLAIGRRFGDIYGPAKARCKAGQEEDSGKVFCGAPGTHHLVAVFVRPGGGPDGDVPSRTVMKDAKVIALMWSSAVF